MENNDREQENMHWLVILMLLCNYDNNLYSAFADSVILENRYMPTDSTTQFFEQFKSFSKQATGYIPKGKTLYRARAIDESYNSKFMNELVDTIADEDFHEESKAFSSPTMSRQSLFESILPVLLSKPEIREKFMCFLQNYKERTFQGFDLAGSAATPASKAPDGRLNPRNISYLYTATDADTAIYEVKPIIGQGVSLATLKPIRRLKVLDLCKKFSPKKITLEGNDLDLPSLIQIVAKQFSIPNHGDTLAYVPTQYIAEYVKVKLGFDGIKFKSSLKKKGGNLVIFDEKLCETTGSKVHYVDNIKINYHSFDQDIDSINWATNE